MRCVWHTVAHIFWGCLDPARSQTQGTSPGPCPPSLAARLFLRRKGEYHSMHCYQRHYQEYLRRNDYLNKGKPEIGFKQWKATRTRDT